MTTVISDYSRKCHPQVDWAAFQIALDTLSPVGFADHTWHNDLCAKLLCETGAGGDEYVTLWVDAADPADRETPEYDAFAVSGEFGDTQVDAGYATLAEAMDQAVLLVAAQRADLDEACALIQTYIGQDDGGVAGMFFTGSTGDRYAAATSWTDRVDLLRSYLKTERAFAAQYA